MSVKYGPYKKATPLFIGILYLSAIILTCAYYFIGTMVFDSALTFFEYLVFTACLSLIIVGGYQLYFWTQYNYRGKRICYGIPLDERIPLVPAFVWIYSLTYYILIGLVIVTLPSLQVGMQYIFGGIILLTVQCLLFHFFPSRLPLHWRRFKTNGNSSKLLAFLHRFDQKGNCMPSMHMSVAAYVSMLLLPIFSYVSFIFIALIALSCVFTKQHTILDIIPGVILGLLVFFVLI